MNLNTNAMLVNTTVAYLEMTASERGGLGLRVPHAPQSFPQSIMISPLASGSVLYLGFGLKMKNFK